MLGVVDGSSAESFSIVHAIVVAASGVVVLQAGSVIYRAAKHGILMSRNAVSRAGGLSAVIFKPALDEIAGFNVDVHNVQIDRMIA